VTVPRGRTPHLINAGGIDTRPPPTGSRWPLIKGKAALRTLYGAVLSTGKTKFTHEYQGADIVGDAVILYGVGKGTVTNPDSSVDRFDNNFILILKYGPDGKMKIWRGAFGPSSQ